MNPAHPLELAMIPCRCLKTWLVLLLCSCLSLQTWAVTVFHCHDQQPVPEQQLPLQADGQAHTPCGQHAPASFVPEHAEQLAVVEQLPIAATPAINPPTIDCEHCASFCHVGNTSLVPSDYRLMTGAKTAPSFNHPASHASVILDNPGHPPKRA